MNNESANTRTSSRRFRCSRFVLCSLTAACCLAGCEPAGTPTGGNEVELPEPNLFAEAEISALSASGISGIVRFDQDAEFLRISGRIDGVATGVHSLSVHEFDNCAMAGTAVTLSIAPDSEGYLGEIRAGENGIAEFELVETRLKLGAGADSILDRPIVIARPERTASQDSVNDIAGTPVGCGEITPVHAPTYTL